MMVVDRQTEEERLIAHMIGYQQGSLDDFEGLYAALKQPLLRYLWTFVRNAATAEDLLQETFLQLHRARRTYQPPRPVRPWIYAITRHVALMHLRSGRRRKEVLADDQLPVEHGIAKSGREIVHDNDVVAAVSEHFYDVAADISGPTCDQYVLIHSLIP